MHVSHHSPEVLIIKELTGMLHACDTAAQAFYQHIGNITGAHAWWENVLGALTEGQ